MTTDLRPLADLDRLRAVARYDLDDPELRHALDAVAARTAARLDGSATAVNILLDRSALTIAGHGLDGSVAGLVGGAPAEWVFCSRVVTLQRPQVVPDVTVDTAGDVNSDPLAASGMRSYAGVPLRTADGRIIGAHCAVHPEPDRYDDAALAVLEDTAGQVMIVLDRYRAGAATSG